MTQEFILRKAERLLSQMEGRVVKLLVQVEKRETTLDIIKEAVCEEFNVSWIDLLKQDRHRHRVTARQLFSYCAMKYLAVGSSYLGRYTGRDHTTIINHRRKIEDMLFVNDAYVADHLRNIEDRIRIATEGFVSAAAVA